MDVKQEYRELAKDIDEKIRQLEHKELMRRANSYPTTPDGKYCIFKSSVPPEWVESDG